MSHKKHHKKDYGYEDMYLGYDDCCCPGFGINNCVAPIIFLLIACGSGILNNNCSYLIILLFLLCGGFTGNLFGGGDYGYEGGYCC